MPRVPRVEYAGAICHVISRGRYRSWILAERRENTSGNGVSCGLRAMGKVNKDAAREPNETQGRQAVPGDIKRINTGPLKITNTDSHAHERSAIHHQKP